MTFVTNTTGSITARAITVTAATSTKGYDGTTSSTAAPTITGGSLATGDTAAFTETFDTRNVGTGKTLTPAGSVNDGNGGNNYTVTFVTNTTGSITARAITVTAATSTKGYDGTTVLDGRADDHRRQPGHRRHGRLHRDLRHQERRHRQDAHAGRLGQRRQRRQQLPVTFATNATGSVTARAITVTAATSTKGYDGTTLLDGRADDHRRQPGHRRHGRLHRDLRHQERGRGQDAHARPARSTTATAATTTR